MTPVDFVFLIVAIISEIVSVFLLIKLWKHKKTSFIKKLFWTFILLVPLAGPIFFCALFDQLPPQPPHLRCNIERLITP